MTEVVLTISKEHADKYLEHKGEEQYLLLKSGCREVRIPVNRMLVLGPGLSYHYYDVSDNDE